MAYARLPECTRVLLVYGVSLIMGTILVAVLTGCTLTQLEDTLRKTQDAAGKVAAGAEVVQSKVSQLDTNKDGKISWWEMLGAVGTVLGGGALVDRLATGSRLAAQIAQAVGLSTQAAGTATAAAAKADAAHQRADRLRTDVDDLYTATHQPVVPPPVVLAEKP